MENGLKGVDTEDEPQKRAEELVKRIGGLEDKIIKEEERPTEQEAREYKTTHSPPKPWCTYCTKAAGMNDPTLTRA